MGEEALHASSVLRQGWGRGCDYKGRSRAEKFELLASKTK
jgi:hypothetical protein